MKPISRYRNSSRLVCYVLGAVLALAPLTGWAANQGGGTISVLTPTK